jgi:hypothetical protein
MLPALPPVRSNVTFNVTHRVAVILFDNRDILDDPIVSDGNVGASLLSFQVSLDRKRMAVAGTGTAMRCKSKMEDTSTVDKSIEVDTALPSQP